MTLNRKLRIFLTVALTAGVLIHVLFSPGTRERRGRSTALNISTDDSDILIPYHHVVDQLQWISAFNPNGVRFHSFILKPLLVFHNGEK